MWQVSLSMVGHLGHLGQPCVCNALFTSVSNGLDYGTTITLLLV
jgi:hypothetical protein